MKVLSVAVCFAPSQVSFGVHCPNILCRSLAALSPADTTLGFTMLQATHGQGVELEPSEEMALAAMQIDKQSARQLLNSSLPVPSEVLMGHQKALAQIATKAHQQRLHVSPSHPWHLSPSNSQDGHLLLREPVRYSLITSQQSLHC